MQVHTLRNANGVEIGVMDYGGIITSIRVPDRHGAFDDVALGFDAPESYRNNAPCFGALIGRYAGRIAHGRFHIDGNEVCLGLNHGEHHLHGGKNGFDAVEWQIEWIREGASLHLFGESADGDQGYPGRLSIDVRYTLDNDNALTLDYRATTDRPTVINLTNHSYFNLGGHATGNVLRHSLRVDADHFLRTDAAGIPDGTLLPTAGSPVDFCTSRSVGDNMDAGLPDHTLVVNTGKPEQARHVARLGHAPSGRVLDVLTTEPGLQVFIPPTLEHLSGLKDGVRYLGAPGICLETQHYPNSPNEPDFPSTRLDPGDVFASTTVYRFSVET